MGNHAPVGARRPLPFSSRHSFFTPGYVGVRFFKDRTAPHRCSVLFTDDGLESIQVAAAHQPQRSSTASRTSSSGLSLQPLRVLPSPVVSSLLAPSAAGSGSMGRAPCCDRAAVKRGPWSPEEDDALRDYMQRHGNTGSWITLPQKAGECAPLMPVRPCL